MIVYVESNFVMELALEQEQHAACENILTLGETNKIRLLVPAYSLVEPYEAIVRRERERSRIAADFEKQIRELTRSIPYRLETEALQKVTDLLSRRNQEEERGLKQAIRHLTKAATIIPLGKNVLTSALKYQQNLKLSPQDALVYASIMQHLATTDAVPKCFLNRNRKDFNTPDIVDTLDKHGCKLMFSFEDGYKYIQTILS